MRFPFISNYYNCFTMSSEISEQRRRSRLSGAARKRFRRLLAADMNTEEALILCRKSWNEISSSQPSQDPNSLKRGPVDEQCPQREIGEPVRKIRAIQFSSQPSLNPASQIRRPVQEQCLHTEVEEASHKIQTVEHTSRIGIRNSTPMTQEQMQLLHDALIMAILETNKAGTGPKFVGFAHKTGWILVTCENEASEDWLTEEVAYLKPWPEADLSIISEHELPKQQVATVFLPLSEANTVEKAVKLLRAQNKGLNPDLWRVLNRKVLKHGSVVTFSLDEPSVETLKATNGKAALGFQKVQFKIKGGVSTESPNQVELSDSSSASSHGIRETLHEMSWVPAETLNSKCRWRLIDVEEDYSDINSEARTEASPNRGQQCSLQNFQSFSSYYMRR